jgi:hypothetical protein
MSLAALSVWCQVSLRQQCLAALELLPWRAVGELQRALLPQIGEVLLSFHPKAARNQGPGQRVPSRCVLEHYKAHAHATAVRGGRERGPETRDSTLN